MWVGEVLEVFKLKLLYRVPNNTVGTKRQIWMFAQNRWVQNIGIQAAVMDAYRNLLMHGEYPIATVWVDCAPDDIDVNIHPTKSMVKFRQSSDSFKAVLRAVRGCLEKAPWVEELVPQKGRVNKTEKMTGPSVAKQQELSSQGDEFLRTQFPQKDFSLMGDFDSGINSGSNSGINSGSNLGEGLVFSSREGPVFSSFFC